MYSNYSSVLEMIEEELLLMWATEYSHPVAVSLNENNYFQLKSEIAKKMNTNVENQGERFVLNFSFGELQVFVHKDDAPIRFLKHSV